MGEVYKARDTRLDRTVALKVLPQEMTADPELRRRFEREARAISAIAHPNICMLFDVGSHDGREFLVMEYLDGESLAERLARGPLSIAEVVRYGIDICEALEKAHRSGIIHRDLKPGNIVLTKSGAKLLDFGLAKWMANDRLSFLARASDGNTTERQPLTGEGTLLGTVPYMAPEQLEGKEIDQRTDIFALGAILYEMATGVRAFDATSNASLIAAIMREHPVPPSRLRPITPRALETIISMCLHKDRGERFQAAHDVKLALTMLTAAPIEEIDEARPKTWLLPLALGALILVAMAVAAAALWLRPRASERTYRFGIAPPAGSAFPSLGEGGGFALSPDGKHLVYVAVTPEGRSFLWLRALDAEAPQLLEATEAAEYPFWSPDSKSIAFFAAGKLKRMDIPDGPPQTICDAPSGRGGTWGASGLILFAPSTKTGLYRVAASGGQPEPVTRVDDTMYSHRWPLLLGDDEHFLFVVQSLDPNKGGLYGGSLKSSQTKRVLPLAASVALAGKDELLYLRDRLLVRQKIDIDELALTGEPRVVANQIVYFVDRAFVPVTAGRDGTVAFRRNAMVNMRLGWYDRTGRRLRLLGEPGELEGISLSPDETRIAFGRFDPEDGVNHIVVCGANDGVPRRFSFNRGNQYSPIWSPDGTRLIYSDDFAGVDTLSEKPASGAAQQRLLTRTPESSQYAQSWSPDGNVVLYRRDDPTNGLDIAAFPLDGGAPQVYISTRADESQAQFSPDGRWVAYASSESGRPEVYVQPYPATGAKWQVSTMGGEQPRWRRDGKELFFLAPDRRLFAVPIEVPGAFDAEPATPLFETTLGVGYLGVSQAYDVTRDGQRFVVASVDPLTPPSPITVVASGVR